MKSFEECQIKESYPELFLERAMNSVIKIPARPSNPALSPSGLGCQRAAAFKLSGAWSREDEETYESALAAEMGSFIHARLQKFMSQSDAWVDIENYIKQRPELNLAVRPDSKKEGETSLVFRGKRNGIDYPIFTFQCDGMMLIDGQYYIIEIKTESEIPWQNRVAPNPKHSSQAVAYSFLYDIPRILWVYASRESFGVHRKIYLESISEKSINSFAAMIQAINKAVEEGMIHLLPKAKDCRYCAFKDECKELDKFGNI